MDIHGNQREQWCSNIIGRSHGGLGKETYQEMGDFSSRLIKLNIEKDSKYEFGEWHNIRCMDSPLRLLFQTFHPFPLTRMHRKR